MNDFLWIILLSIVPVAELRAAIPYGIFAADIPLLPVVLVSALSNILVAPIAYGVLHFAETWLRHLAFFDRFWSSAVLRGQRRVHPYIEKYGILGVALFIGVPLPGTGVYTAALGAYALGVPFRKFFIASAIGVLIAAAAVTIISLFGEGAWLWLIR
ncbi:small multi-drug export protein [Candidatus Woesearchaeota archaeon]|nr:small multi-drug export protein [Candidatus Woesearchaeota archaeon]